MIIVNNDLWSYGESTCFNSEEPNFTPNWSYGKSNLVHHGDYDIFALYLDNDFEMDGDFELSQLV